jgi:integrase
MKCSLQNPSYLVRNVHSYCFRLIVPKDLHKFVGKTELRYTLRTGYIGVAKRKARFLAGEVQLLFQLFRRGFVGMGKLSEDQIQQLVVKYIKQSVERLDKVFEVGDDQQRPYDDPPSLQSYTEGLSTVREDLIHNLSLGDFSMLENAIETFLKENGVDEVDKQSPAYRRLCIEVHKAETQLIPIQQQHMRCDFSYKDQLPKIFPDVFGRREEAPPPPDRREDRPPKQPPVFKLSQVFEEYWTKKEQELKPRSLIEFKRTFDHFIAFVGKNTDIREIDKEILRKYKRRLETEEYRPGKKRDNKTVNDKYLTVVKGFFTKAVDYGYIDRNPMVGLIDQEKREKRPDEERDPYTIEDLRKIFCESPEYSGDQMVHPHQFWIPLIGLYTGMRLEEICQLYVPDLKQMDGVWCLDINQNRPDKSVKTDERRIVPLHPFLLNDLNFVGYVQILPQDGRIFPELKRIANRYSHHVSPWFSKFKDRCGVVARSGNKAFHSFRHTVTDHLFKQEVNQRVISMLVGHAIKGETGGRYGKRYEPKLLYEKAVLKLDYGLDLSHLKNSKWVVR